MTFLSEKASILIENSPISAISRVFIENRYAHTPNAMALPMQE
jgi:hypothetical protein